MEGLVVLFRAFMEMFVFQFQDVDMSTAIREVAWLLVYFEYYRENNRILYPMLRSPFGDPLLFSSAKTSTPPSM